MEAITVLVVEDDVLVRECAAEALGEGGVNVLQAADAPEALQLLEAVPVDVVFTDVNMPGEFDGLGLARRIRERWTEIAVVVTSGRCEPDGDLQCACFVPKPYMPDALPRLLDEVLHCHANPALGAMPGVWRADPSGHPSFIW